MANAYQLQQESHMNVTPNPRAWIRNFFLDEVTKVMGQLNRERFAVLGNMLASELYCSQFSQSDLEAMAKNGGFIMGTTVRVALTDSDLPCSVDGRYSHTLHLREPLPFPIGFQGFVLPAGCEYWSAVQNYIRERDQCELSHEFRKEITSILNCDLLGLVTAADMLTSLGRCGPVSNQVAYDLAKAAGKFELDPKGVSL